MRTLIAHPILVSEITALAVLICFTIWQSVRIVGPAEVGLVMKRFGSKLPSDNPIAFHGEAGYQADLLMPGVRFKWWFLYKVEKFPWVQVPANEIGVLIAQVGKTLPAGAKSARYKKEFGNFTDLYGFISNEGEKGVQRPLLAPGSLLPIHPVAFLIITKNKVFGLPISPDLQAREGRNERLTPASFNLEPKQLDVFRVEPQLQQGSEEKLDVVGVVTTLEGEPLESGHIASRLGGFGDMEKLELAGADDQKLIEVLLGDKNASHNNYQDFQAFLNAGGKMGLQHDVLRYGAYTLNPFLVRVEIVPMLVVKQGEAAAIKAYVGLVTQDTSGPNFKFGSLVKPGHRGLWEDPLRTGKYAINPRIYKAEVVPTAILKLDWAAEVTGAHGLDKNLQPIVAKSDEGFVFKIDLQVLIHVPDTKAPKVISMVGTMKNLVDDVLQAAVGNLFRDKLGSMHAIQFIETRQEVQQEAFKHIQAQLAQYDVETRGVYIQDVILPQDLVKVLTEREIANQQIATFQKQEEAQKGRIAMEKAKGTADMQSPLARSEVEISIKENNAKARKAEADGEATFTSRTGAAKAAEVEAVGLAKAKAYKEQVSALGQSQTALVNVADVLSRGTVPFMPNILVTGGNGDGNAANGLMATLTAMFAKSLNAPAPPVAASEPAPAQAKS
jgi:regulator of protease activity HflC (stomatin/prohibitin superfamily)